MASEDNRKPILIVQGGQWGSEAKGLITHKLTISKKVEVAIRTGTVNAGHTVYHKGTPYAMQQLPVSWVDPDCKLVLGPGAYIHPPILLRELGWIASALGQTVEDVLRRVFIDYRCGLHTQAHTDRSKASGRHHLIGTTGKGCSEAVTDKINGRSWSHLPLFRDHDFSGIDQIRDRIVDTVEIVNKAYDAGRQLLIEGTQGTLLDLHLGEYPYVTHKQTQAASWMAESGLSCTLPVDLWLVMRTMPIRVAGCSGHLPNEISWTMLARRMNKFSGGEMVSDRAIREWISALREVWGEEFPDAPGAEPALWTLAQKEANKEAASEMHKMALEALSTEDFAEITRLFELTTVTKKLRRIGDWDWDTTRKTITLNRPSHLALTFMNYRYPEIWGATPTIAYHAGNQEWKRWAKEVSDFSEGNGGGPVGIVSFGPQLDATFEITPDGSIR